MPGTSLYIRNILCPTDFSPPAATALEESVRLARWFGARVTVLHVIPFTVPLAGDVGLLPVTLEANAATRRAALQSLQRVVDATERAGVPIELVCREGDACEEIRRVGREAHADLVVMGTHGRSGFTRLMLGSVTEAVLRHPPVPVLTVSRELPRRVGLYRTVLCATDVSESSAGTLGAALAMAGDDAKRLTVLNVIEGGVGSLRESPEHTAMTALHRLVPDEARSALLVDERVALGASDREILGVAAEEAADLIVMGTRGHGAFGPLFGSTVRRVVRDAACPVLVVPAGFVWPATEPVSSEHVGRPV